jgi:predicted dehydrogenase
MIKIGIIGSGFGLYGLLPAFNSIKGCQVVCICGKKTERLTKYCAEIGLDKIYSDWGLMLQNEDLHAVAVAVPPAVQYQIAKAAMRKGLHVFGEKPLAANLKQAKELVALAKKKKIVTAVDFIFPEIPQWQKVKQLLDSGTYGKLKCISTTWDFLSYDISHGQKSWKTDADQGGGAVSFYFSHCLYYLENFAGKIEKVQSVLTYSKQSLNGGEVGIDVILKFQNGVTGQAHVHCNAKGMNRHRLEFICEQATILLENENSPTENFTLNIKTENQDLKVKVKQNKSAPPNQDVRVQYVQNIAKRFVSGCASGKLITPSFEDGAQIQELIKQIRDNQI